MWKRARRRPFYKKSKLRSSLDHLEPAYLETGETFIIELFFKSSQRLKAFNYFCKRAPS